MADKKSLVVVLSRNYSTGLSVIRSVGAAGYDVDLVASAPSEGASAISAASKYVRRSVEITAQKVKEDNENTELLHALLAYKGQQEEKPVLFPVDDYTTFFMDQHRSLLEDIFIMPTIIGGGDGCIMQKMDKAAQAQMARKAGLLTPREWIISLANPDIIIPKDMVYPCFVKPLESATGYKTEMAVCNNENRLMRHLQKLRKNFSDRSILVQEYLRIDNEIDLSGVCLDQEIIIPAIIKKLNIAKFERGVTLAGKVIPIEEIKELAALEENIINMLREFRYFGMFDMELNVVGDKIYFNEVNLRSGGPNYAYFMSGANLPALFVKEALTGDHDIADEVVAEYGKTFIYEKVAWEDHLHDFMTKKDLKNRLSSADMGILINKNDPAPGRLFMKKMRKAAFIKNVKNRIKKTIKSLIKTFGPLIKLLRNIKYFLCGYPQSKRRNKRKPLADKPRVLISGRNYCSNLCMARSIGEAGYDVEIMRVFQARPRITALMKRLHPDAYSKHIKAYHLCVSKRRSKRILNKLISIADPYRKMLLIPADDLVAEVADRYYDILKDYYMLPNIKDTAGEIGRLMSKKVQKNLADAAGLPTVNSCVITVGQGGKPIIPDSVSYPCFIKPNVSRNSNKSRMRKCMNRQELFSALKEFSKENPIEMLVEDFMDIEKEFAILGISTKDGVFAPGFFSTEEGGHEDHRGIALIGKILPTETERKLIDDIVKFIEGLGYTGLFDVDLIRTKDGKMYFVELNLRFGASGYAITRSGLNLPGMFADYMLLKKPLDFSRKLENPGKTFISEKVMIDEYVNGFLTKEEMKEKMQQVDIHFIQNDDDPAAYKHFKKFYSVASLIRKVRSLRSRG